MAEPIIARYRLSVELLAEANRIQKRVGRSWLWAAWMVGCQVITSVCVVYLLWQIRFQSWDELILGFCVLLAAAMFALIGWLDSSGWDRWAAKWVLSKMPEAAKDVEWIFTDELIDQRTGLSTASFVWELVTKVVEVPEGFQLHRGKMLLDWIPAAAFETPEEIPRFVRLARSRVAHYVVLGECRFIASPVPTGVDNL